MPPLRALFYRWDQLVRAINYPRFVTSGATIGTYAGRIAKVLTAPNAMPFTPRIAMHCAAAAALVLCEASVTRAQDEEQVNEAPQPGNAPRPAGEPALTDQPPSSEPAKLEQAREQAEVAELTPIVPSPENPTQPAFQLYSEVDLPILSIGFVILWARFLRTQKAYCAPLCDPAELNELDRTTAGFYSAEWSSFSTYGLYGLSASSVALLLIDEGLLDGLNDIVVIAESALSATAVSSIMTVAEGRPRPLLYGDKAPLSERNKADAGLSFLSSHASVSFGIATSTFMTMKRLHPKSPLPYVVLGVGDAAASLIATARVMAGKHFISDAIGGAIIGTSVGVLVPALHKSPVKVAPVVNKTEHRLELIGVF